MTLIKLWGFTRSLHKDKTKSHTASRGSRVDNIYALVTLLIQLQLDRLWSYHEILENLKKSHLQLSVCPNLQILFKMIFCYILYNDVCLTRE